jgi:ketosteroid isomerase-like protein
VYAAFDARDAEAIAECMHPEVDWRGAWKGGRMRGRADVLAYRRRQFVAIDPRATPERFTERDDGPTAVDVDQVVRSPAGDVLGDRRWCTSTRGATARWSGGTRRTARSATPARRCAPAESYR